MVEFDIRRGAVSDLKDGISDWFTYLGGVVDSSELDADGRVELGENMNGFGRSASWQTVGGPGASATRIEVRDVNLEDETELITRVTVGDVNGRIRARVSMALDRPAGLLAPISPTRLSQPGIIWNWTTDERVDLVVQGKVLSGRYQQVRTDEEASLLISEIRSRARLPVVVVHARTKQANDAAWRAASRLVGLARVVTVDYRAARILESVNAEFAPPYAGARLIWSDPAARTRSYASRVVNSDGADDLRAQLMSLLAPVSVIAHGVDATFRAAQQAGTLTRLLAARHRSDVAAATGDSGKIIEALRSELATAQEDREVWAVAAQEAEDEANELRAQAELVPSLQAQVEQLTLALSFTEAEADQGVDLWESLPDLVSGSEDSAAELFVALEEAADEHIVFTERAARSWKEANYPYPVEMREALIKLAKVADDLYDGTDREMGHLDEWVYTNHALRIALQDGYIKKRVALRDFIFEGEVHDRTPHVKVRDAAPHPEVGRIHFALDSGKKRLIVDHVGAKLY